MQCQACLFQAFGSRQIFGGIQRALKEIVQIQLREFLRQLLPLPFVRAFSGGAAAGIELLHDAVERVGALAADVQIQTQGGNRALLVIADDGVRAVFVLFVIFVPCGKARLRQRLVLPPARPLHAREVFRQQRQIIFYADNAAAHQNQVVVIRRDAFVCPKLFRVHFRI